jgi:hypothetical protein
MASRGYSQDLATEAIIWLSVIAATPVPEVMAVDLAAPLLADHDVLEGGQVEVAPVVELPEPQL